jgi:hypothetical protein
MAISPLDSRSERIRAVAEVIDGQLFAGHDVSDGPDKHTTPLLHCLAVRLAAMVEPTCRIATTSAVDDVSVI